MQRATGNRPVILVGFQNQPNLGIGYLAGTLRRAGVEVHVYDVEAGDEAIVRAALELRPVLIGLSLIFQFYTARYRQLVAALRASGVSCHITVGGHFPSLCWRDALQHLPGIDSIVRFEGELTLVELVRALDAGGDWRGLEGIACRDAEGRAIVNPPRPLVDDLDSLPYPVRIGARQRVIGFEALPLLASRGCARSCTFCSIRRFYRGAPGRAVRVRDPDRVVAEMRSLFDGEGTRIFLFQDDDFPVWGSFGRRWSMRFIDALETHGLTGRVVWKISCRVDEVEPQLFGALRDAGLYFVYLGVESGTDEGLASLRKQTTAAACLEAVGVLDQLGLLCQYGFMLFDPSSTLETVRANVAFLKALIRGGRRAASFCKMLPYAGTEVESRLRADGRLRGTIEEPNYEFLDPRLDLLVAALEPLVRWWFGPEGASYRLNGAWQEVAVFRRLFPPLPGLDAYDQFLVAVTGRANDALLAAVDATAVAVEGGLELPLPSGALVEASAMLSDVLSHRDSFVAANRDVLLDTIEVRPASRHRAAAYRAGRGLQDARARVAGAHGEGVDAVQPRS